MQWKKRGLIFCPDGHLTWAQSHAYIPTAEVLDSGAIRVYIACLDAEQFGRITYLDLDGRDPARILYVHDKPILDLGVDGTFDDSGLSPSCVVNVGAEKRLYYIGWQRAMRVPYMLFTGVAISEDGGKTFSRHAQVPILDRTYEEPFLRSAPAVLTGGGTFRAWYVSGLAWVDVNGRFLPRYVLRQAESVNGLVWTEHNPIVLDFHSTDEFGFGRPWVVRSAGGYRMWYSIRSTLKPYRIGYAESQDGLTWVRKDDEVGVSASSEGWDSEMICFPCVITAHGRTYMFYNGNQHGRTGFGYAELIQD